MRIYETMFIIAPDVPQEERENLVERVKKLIEERVGGKIESVDRWGLRKLAYKIKQYTEGDYTVIMFRAEGDKLNELEYFYRVTPEIFRWQTFRRFDLERKERKSKRSEEHSEVIEEQVE